jgi:hypothetical protein
MTVKKKSIDEDLEITGINETVNGPQITVKAPDEKEPASLTERLKDFAPKTPRKPRAKRPIKGKQIDANLISKLAPTLVATFVATYSRQMLKEPYKMCAPSQQEVMTIVSPLFNILSRQVEITGQASETVIDLITCAIASIIFGTRAYVTYATIKENEQSGKSHGNVATTNITGSNGSSPTRSNSAKDSSDIGTSELISTDDTNGVTGDSDGDSEHTRQDANLFSELFAKDIEGRIRLGYLPPRISATNE